MIIPLILLLAGDIESNPGPITMQEYKDMTPQQRKTVLKDDLSQLLQGILENSDEEISLTLTTIMTELRAIKTELVELKTLKETVEKNKKEIGELKEEVRKQTEVIELQQRYLERVDGAERGKKLIVLGMKEDDEVPDNETVDELLNLLQVKNDVAVSDVKRLGNRREETDGDEPVVHKRPMLVTVGHVGMRNTVLKNANKLKDEREGSKFYKIFIKADELPAVRNEMNRLYQVFKAEKDKPENVGVEVRLNRKERTVTRNGQVIDKFSIKSFFQ